MTSVTYGGKYDRFLHPPDATDAKVPGIGMWPDGWVVVQLPDQTRKRRVPKVTRMKQAYYPGKTNLAILQGDDDLSLWDEEELIRGQRKNKRGRFPNNPPKIVPKALHDELVKRKLTKAYDLLNESIYDAVAILIDIAKDTRTEDGVRLKAVKEILDRTIGKTPINLNFSLEPNRMAEAFQAMLIPDDDSPAPLPQRSEHDIVDAEVVDDDEPFQ